MASVFFKESTILPGRSASRPRTAASTVELLRSCRLRRVRHPPEQWRGHGRTRPNRAQRRRDKPYRSTGRGEPPYSCRRYLWLLRSLSISLALIFRGTNPVVPRGHSTTHFHTGARGHDRTSNDLYHHWPNFFRMADGSTAAVYLVRSGHCTLLHVGSLGDTAPLCVRTRAFSRHAMPPLPPPSLLSSLRPVRRRTQGVRLEEIRRKPGVLARPGSAAVTGRWIHVRSIPPAIGCGGSKGDPPPGHSSSR